MDIENRFQTSVYSVGESYKYIANFDTRQDVTSSAAFEHNLKLNELSFIQKFINNS